MRHIDKRKLGNISSDFPSVKIHFKYSFWPSRIYHVSNNDPWWRPFLTTFKTSIFWPLHYQIRFAGPDSPALIRRPMMFRETETKALARRPVQVLRRGIVDVDFLLAWAIPMLSLLIAKPGASLHTLFRGGGGGDSAYLLSRKELPWQKLEMLGTGLQFL